MRMNKLNWYDFTVGYLIQAHYDVVKATLIINIDVPRTLEHPRHKEATCFEETFANVNLIFKEVRYLKNIVSANMTSDPNEDAGDTEYIICAPASDDLLKELGFGDKKIQLDYGDGTNVSLSWRKEPLMYTKFETAETIFHIVFRELNIVETADKLKKIWAGSDEEKRRELP